jgi:hypothetical protein
MPERSSPRRVANHAPDGALFRDHGCKILDDIGSSVFAAASEAEALVKLRQAD